MPTPKKGYYAADGKRVPSVTTILGGFKDPGGLKHWAWELGLQGIDYRDVSKEAASIGTVVHQMVEDSRNGRTPDMDLSGDDAVKALAGFRAYEAWSSLYEVKLIEQEIQLVSEWWRFGGTPDAVGYADGKLYLFDWKTSNRVYADYLVQIAAYYELWNENRETKLENGAHILRFSKDYGNFTHFQFTHDNIQIGWRQFRRFREAYEDNKILDKIVG